MSLPGRGHVMRRLGGYRPHLTVVFGDDVDHAAPTGLGMSTHPFDPPCPLTLDRSSSQQHEHHEQADHQDPDGDQGR